MECLCQATDSELIEMMTSHVEPCRYAVDYLEESVSVISLVEQLKDSLVAKASLEEADLPQIVEHAEELIGWAECVRRAADTLHSRQFSEDCLV
ncbi:MAG: hypothetical protein GY826_06895 [Fuerstiella sp.]|nr:hypothetical protein [Fuerstiella sp.]